MMHPCCLSSLSQERLRPRHSNVAASSLPQEPEAPQVETLRGLLLTVKFDVGFSAGLTPQELHLLLFLALLLLHADTFSGLSTGWVGTSTLVPSIQCVLYGLVSPVIESD